MRDIHRTLMDYKPPLELSMLLDNMPSSSTSQRPVWLSTSNADLDHEEHARRSIASLVQEHIPGDAREHKLLLVLASRITRIRWRHTAGDKR